MIDKPHASVIKLLKIVSTKYEIPMDKVKEKYNEIFDRDSIQRMSVASKTERQKHAARVLFAEITGDRDKAKFAGKTVPVTIRVESKGEISEFKRQGSSDLGYRSEMYVTVQDEEENVALAKLTLWNDANECHHDFIEGEMYTTKCVIGKRGDIWQMSMNAPEEVSDEVDIELIPLKELIVKIYTPIGIEDVENNISADRDELKLVEGAVVTGWAKVTSNGRDMGFLKIMEDMDPDNSFMAKFSGNANCVNAVSIGDFVYVLGQTTPAVLNDDGTTKYDVGMWGELIIRVIAIDPRDDEPKNNENESDDDDDDGTDFINGESDDDDDDEETDDEETDESELEENIAGW